MRPLRGEQERRFREKVDPGRVLLAVPRPGLQAARPVDRGCLAVHQVREGGTVMGYCCRCGRYKALVYLGAMCRECLNGES